MQNFITLTNGSLLLKHIEKKDKGQYICEAINKFGQAKASVYLEVYPARGKYDAKITLKRTNTKAIKSNDFKVGFVSY